MDKTSKTITRISELIQDPKHNGIMVVATSSRTFLIAEYVETPFGGLERAYGIDFATGDEIRFYSGSLQYVQNCALDLFIKLAGSYGFTVEQFELLRQFFESENFKGDYLTIAKQLNIVALGLVPTP